MSKIATILIFILLFLEFFHPISAITQDLGRHLLTGRIILQTHTVPYVNLFSYTYSQFPFINHHWLSEMLLYLAYQETGFTGLLVLTVLTVTIAFSCIFFYSFKKSNLFALAGVSVLYLRVLSERTDVRPEIFSFLFLSLFITILYSYREKYTRWIFLLPFLQLLWVNMHIYFPIGIVVLGLFLIDGVIINKGRFWCRYTSILVFITFASSLLSLVNPHGIDGVLYPLTVFKNYGYSIEENQNIFFLEQLTYKPSIVYFKISVLLLFISLILSFRHTKLLDWLLAIICTGFSMMAIRNLPLFVFATFIPCVYYVSLVVKRYTNHLNRKITFCAFFFLLIVYIVQVIQITQAKPIGVDTVTGASPGVDFLLRNNIPGPLFNNFDIGSYLEYRLYPQEKVFVDGRPEAYPSDFFQKVYIPMQQDTNIFTAVSTQYRFNTIFFSHTDQTPWAESFLKSIVNNSEWKIVYLDDYIVILVKDSFINKKIVQQYTMDQTTVTISHLQNTNISSLKQLAHFFNIVGWQQQEQNMYSSILSLNQNFCPALYNYSVLLYKANNPAYTVYSHRYDQVCQRQ